MGKGLASLSNLHGIYFNLRLIELGVLACVRVMLWTGLREMPPYIYAKSLSRGSLRGASLFGLGSFTVFGIGLVLGPYGFGTV